MIVLARAGKHLPAWLPDPARIYLRHTEEGLSIRALARSEGCHASTILRKIRKYESRRDDPLVDEALDRLGARATRQVRAPIVSVSPTQKTLNEEDESPMTAPLRPSKTVSEEETINREARRILRRLCETSAQLIVAPDMEKAVVLKGTVRTAVVDRTVAQAFALKDWISIARNGRVTVYQITNAGRAALKRLLAEQQNDRQPGFTENQAEFDGSYGEQHRVWAERTISETNGARPRRMRYNLAESPVAALARRKDRDGKPFLAPELLGAAERLREDFELAQMGPRVAQNWDRFLTAGDRGNLQPSGNQAEGPARARDRVGLALRDLGPGLGDMALRCCCFLEGLEAAEKRLGWSARSGKIVLRIALQRLKRHYDDVYGGASPLIG